MKNFVKFLLIGLVFMTSISFGQDGNYYNILNSKPKPGNGVSDDNSVILKALNQYKSVFFPRTASGYKITGTLVIPAGCRLVFDVGAKFIGSGTIKGNGTEIVGQGLIFASTLSFSGTFDAPFVDNQWFQDAGDYTVFCGLTTISTEIYSNPSGSGIIDITFVDLLSKITDSTLLPGSFYEISDFAATVYNYDYTADTLVPVPDHKDYTQISYFTNDYDTINSVVGSDWTVTPSQGGPIYTATDFPTDIIVISEPYYVGDSTDTYLTVDSVYIFIEFNTNDPDTFNVATPNLIIFSGNDTVEELILSFYQGQLVSGGFSLYSEHLNDDMLNYEDLLTRLNNNEVFTFELSFTETIVISNISIHGFTFNVYGTDVASYDSIRVGPTEPLVVFSTSTSSISNRAYSPQYPTDEICYSADSTIWINHSIYSKTGNEMIPGWKGSMYLRKIWNDTVFPFNGSDAEFIIVDPITRLELP